jgi:hypothetical protein
MLSFFREWAKQARNHQMLHYTYNSEPVGPKIDNGTPIVHEDSRDIMIADNNEASSDLHSHSKTCIEKWTAHTKGTLVPAHTMNACRRTRGTLEVSGQFHAPAVVFPGTEPQYSLNITLGEPQSRSGSCSEKRKIPCSYRDSKAGSSTR